MDLDEIKLRSLADAVVRAEAEHQRVSDLYNGAPARELAIAAVVTEASAMWYVESRPGDGPEAWAEIAQLVTEYINEQASSIVFALLPVDVRRDAERRVIADLMGPSDDDGS